MPSSLSTPSLRMAWAQAPWDQVVCGFPVIQISDFEILGEDASEDMKLFEHERDRLGAGLVSYRLSHERLKESMLLEDHGFRFIEMIYTPEIELKHFDKKSTPLLTVHHAREEDMPTLLAMAQSSFKNERFKVDPRIDPAISDQRYANWVASSFRHPSQELFSISDQGTPVAFFITETLGDGTCYWHLNAVQQAMQGQGYGRRAWVSMLHQAAQSGAQKVRTSITARNHKVLNLYARLGFYFPAPCMTFHWLKPGHL